MASAACGAAGRLDRSHDFLGGLLVRGVVHAHPRPVAGQSLRGVPPDAAAGTRHERRLPVSPDIVPTFSLRERHDSDRYRIKQQSLLSYALSR